MEVARTPNLGVHPGVLGREGESIIGHRWRKHLKINLVCIFFF